MAQRVKWGNLSATGIVGTLVILGIVLYAMGTVANDSNLTLWGGVAIASGIVIGILYAILGILGIVQRYGGRIV